MDEEAKEAKKGKTMDELKQLELEQQKMMKRLKVIDQLIAIVESRSLEKRASKYNSLMFLLKEIVWLQSAKKEFPEQVNKFNKQLSEVKIKIEVKEEGTLYKQMSILDLGNVMENVVKKKRTVSINMFAEKNYFIKYQCEMSHNEILLLHDKSALKDMCRYMTIIVPKSANKDKLAGSFSAYMREYPMKILPALSYSASKLLLEFVNMQDGENVIITEDVIDDYIKLMFWGLLSVELISREGELHFAIGMPKAVEQNVIPIISLLDREGMMGENVAGYLDGTHLYTLERLYRSYDEIFEQIKGIVIMYGVVGEEELYELVTDLLDRKWDNTDFKRFIYLKGTFQQNLRTGENRITKQRVVGFSETIMQEYLALEKFPVEQICKYENYKELELELKNAYERWKDVRYVMEQWDFSLDELEDLIAEKYLHVTRGQNPGYILNALIFEYDIEDVVDIACLWRAMMLICLQQPCYLLRGYSRLRAEQELGLNRYYGMFEVEPIQQPAAKLRIDKLPESFQKQLADMVLLSHKGMLEEVLEAEQKVEKKYRANQTVNTVLTMNLIDAYQHLSSKEQKKQWDEEVRQRLQRWLSSIKDDEERNLMISWCEEKGFYVPYEQKMVSKEKNKKSLSIDEKMESYLWGDNYTEMMPIVKSKKIYPNDPCPCGSGKKYKKCCGIIS